MHEYGDPDAPVLLVLHGITDSGQCWSDLVERLGSTYRIVAPDALGHGASDRFSAEELKSEHPPEAMYDAAAQVLREVGPALVLGHSMGGRTAGRPRRPRAGTRPRCRPRGPGLVRPLPLGKLRRGGHRGARRQDVLGGG